MFQLTFIFRILRSWKAFFYITPFRPTSYVLMRLKWLEFSNRVRNWNKVKNFIFVESKLELCQLQMLIFIYKLMCQNSLMNMFHFCSMNLIVYQSEKKEKYYFRTFIFSNSQIELLVSFSRSTNVNVNTSFSW